MLDLDELDRKGIAEAVNDRTAGRGADGVIDAVGMEAHGSPVAKLGHKVVGMMPDRVAEKLMTRAGTDRLAALQTAIEVVRRGGTISVIGVYGGMTDPLPLLTLFDKQVHLRMGQANVRHWVDDLMPLVGDDDPLGAGYVRHPPPPAGGGAGRLCHVPGQARRCGQGAVPALIAR